MLTERALPPGSIKAKTVTVTMKLISAIFFLMSIIQVVVVNKALKTNRYGSYQVFGLSQLVTAVVVLWIGRSIKLLQFPHLDRRIASRIYPLIVFCGGSMVTNPMNFGIEQSLYESSRCIVILITVTAVLEYIILDVQMSSSEKFIIALMVIPPLAGRTDGSVSFGEYVMILLNYSFSSATRVYFKKILDSRELGVSGVLYYSTIIMIIPPTLEAFVFKAPPDSIDLLIHWSSLPYWCHLLLTSVITLLMSCSAIMCIQNNGPLTTTIIGSLVNIIITIIAYMEWLKDSEADYYPRKFSWHYYVGWNILILASVVHIVMCIFFKPNFAVGNTLVNEDEEPI